MIFLLQNARQGDSQIKFDDDSELPKGISNNLPKNAQKLYKEVFNSAYDRYKHDANVEQIAHRVAWGAVKEKFEKTGNRWQKKQQE